MAIIPVNNIINVTVTGTPSGLTEKNANSLALFTTETPDSLDDYTIYVSATQVATEYGTSSVTAQMANAIFSQTPNLRTGSGRLVVIPLLSSVSATEGEFETTDLTANLTNLIGVSDGDLQVTIDGIDYDLTGLNFTNADTIADVATILQKKLVNAVVTSTATEIVFTSKKVGASSAVDLGSIAGGSGTDVSGATYLDASSGTATGGADSSGETILEAIARTSGAVGYVPFITNLNLEDDAIVAIANGTQAQDRMFVHHVTSTADIDGVITDISSAGNDKTRPIYYSESQAAANLTKAAYAGRAFSVNFSGSFTAQTMQLKELATITPDDGITQTIYENLKTAGADFYCSIDGVPSVISTGGNDFFDNVYSDLALKFALETAGFNHLRQTNTKVPQTEQGMNGLKTAYADVMERFVRNGYIAGGSWTSSETFGDPEIFKQNVLDNGYYIYSLPITQQSSIEREARIAPLVQIAAKRAGAIHTGDVLVLVND